MASPHSHSDSNRDGLCCPSCSASIQSPIVENGELICPACGCVLEGSQLVSQLEYTEDSSDQVGTFVSRSAVSGGWLSQSARIGAPLGASSLRSSDSEQAQQLRRRTEAKRLFKEVLRQLEQLQLVGRLRSDEEEQGVSWHWTFVEPRRRIGKHRQQQAAAAVIYLQARQNATQRSPITYLDLARVLNRDEKQRIINCFQVGQLVREVAQALEADLQLAVPLLQHVRWPSAAFADRLCRTVAVRRALPHVPPHMHLASETVARLQRLSRHQLDLVDRARSLDGLNPRGWAAAAVFWSMRACADVVTDPPSSVHPLAQAIDVSVTTGAARQLDLRRLLSLLAIQLPHNVKAMHARPGAAAAAVVSNPFTSLASPTSDASSSSSQTSFTFVDLLVLVRVDPMPLLQSVAAQSDPPSSSMAPSAAQFAPRQIKQAMIMFADRFPVRDEDLSFLLEHLPRMQSLLPSDAHLLFEQKQPEKQQSHDLNGDDFEDVGAGVDVEDDDLDDFGDVPSLPPAQPSTHRSVPAVIHVQASSSSSISQSAVRTPSFNSRSRSPSPPLPQPLTPLLLSTSRARSLSSPAASTLAARASPLPPTALPSPLHSASSSSSSSSVGPSSLQASPAQASPSLPRVHMRTPPSQRHATPLPPPPLALQPGRHHSNNRAPPSSNSPALTPAQASNLQSAYAQPTSTPSSSSMFSSLSAPASTRPAAASQPTRSIYDDLAFSLQSSTVAVAPSASSSSTASASSSRISASVHLLGSTTASFSTTSFSAVQPHLLPQSATSSSVQRLQLATSLTAGTTAASTKAKATRHTFAKSTQTSSSSSLLSSSLSSSLSSPSSLPSPSSQSSSSSASGQTSFPSQDSSSSSATPAPPKPVKRRKIGTDENVFSL